MVMANLTKALAAGGAKIADVTKITIYICNPHDVPTARGILQTYFAGAAPASTLCILRGLANPNLLLEIEAIAAVGVTGRRSQAALPPNPLPLPLPLRGTRAQTPLVVLLGHAL